MGRLRVKLFARRYLLPQWKVLACDDSTIFGCILSSHYIRVVAERRAASLNKQIAGVPIGVSFKAQKNTCF